MFMIHMTESEPFGYFIIMMSIPRYVITHINGFQTGSIIFIQSHHPGRIHFFFRYRTIFQ